MKKLNVFIVFFLLIFISCINNTPNENIKTSIEPKEFQKIIKKAIIMNAHIQNNKQYSLIDKDTIMENHL